MQFALIAKTVSRCTGRNTRSPALNAYGGHVGAASRALQGDTLAGAEAATDDALEGEAKVLGEERIDHGIHRRVAVAQPEEDREEQRINAVLAEWPYNIHREERTPAEDEHADDNGQCLGRLCFHAKAFHLRLDIPPAHLLIGGPAMSCPPQLTRVALASRQLRQRFAHLQITGAAAMMLLLPVELGLRGLASMATTVVVHGEEGIVRGTPLVDCLGLCQLVDVLAGWIGHGDLDLVVLMMQSSCCIFAQSFRRWCAQCCCCALCAAIAVHRVLLIRAASTMNAKRQTLLLEAGADALGACLVGERGGNKRNQH